MEINKEMCPLIGQCTMFYSLMFITDVVRKTYMARYCSKSIQFKKCKRYLVCIETGKQAPEYIMPNSLLTIDEIRWRIE
jgi:hypothetical protein